MSARGLPASSLGGRLQAHRRGRRSDVVARGVVDMLTRRRETDDDPPDLHDARARVDALRGSMDLDDLRDAAIDEAVAALAIVCCLPPRELLLPVIEAP